MLLTIRSSAIYQRSAASYAKPRTQRPLSAASSMYAGHVSPRVCHIYFRWHKLTNQQSEFDLQLTLRDQNKR